MKGPRRKHKYPTKEQLLELFTYHLDVKGAYLAWRYSVGSASRFKAAGTVTFDHKDEALHQMIKINGVAYNQRDLIWIYHYGEVPVGGLTYRDGDKWNHRIENLVPIKPVVSFM